MRVTAVDYLRSSPPAGNGFNQFEWGGYLIHQLWPGQRVFIDGQSDFYGEALFREYAQVAEQRDGWADVLGRRGVEWMICGSDSSLVRLLVITPGWRVAHRDPVATVLVRSHPASPESPGLDKRVANRVTAPAQPVVA